ncbi:hypothetical protein CDD80_5425 [Ophiocordyceps camponoti-rufipedis]|uniref:RRM domain-containing protein n=1 Tax=Ophiocordyceps camponoti-rufipedis TaxID=2004952 RepID=A0A2C5XZC8_9HYPO|nr:hypothetical protein CDD80_5425 [Ophiocordyceps camponoti-rufipedis]
MKTLLVSCLLVAGSASGQHDAAPSCVDKCVKAVQIQSASSVEALRSICGDGTSQRAVFQCLINSCHSGSYGPALGHVAHACSQLGHDIGPLHPIEVHYALQKRQFIPTAPGPVLPGPSTLYNTQIFTFSHRLSMDLECKAGSDGVLTVSVNDADSTVTSKTPAATHDASLVAAGVGGSLHGPATQTPSAALHQGHDASAGQANCTSSLPVTSPIGVGASSTSAHTQGTACPCSSEASSSVFDSPFGSASLLQGPTEQQPVSLPSSTHAPLSTSKPQHTDGEDCETSLPGNFTTVVSGHAPVTPLPVPVTSHTDSLSTSLQASATPMPLPASTTSTSEYAETSDCSGSLSGFADTAISTSTAPNATSSTSSAATTTPWGTVTTVATVGPLPASSPCSNSSMPHATVDVSIAHSSVMTPTSLTTSAASTTSASSATSATLVPSTTPSGAPIEQPKSTTSCAADDSQCQPSVHLMSIESPAETTSCSSEEGGFASVQGADGTSVHPVPAEQTTAPTQESTSTVGASSTIESSPSSVTPSVIPSTSFTSSSVSASALHLNSSTSSVTTLGSSLASSTVATPGVTSSSTLAAPGISPTSSTVAVSSISSASSSSSIALSSTPSTSATSSTLTSSVVSSISASRTASVIHLTEPPNYSSVTPSALPVYVTPLAGYTYHGPAPEYTSPAASTTDSSVAHQVSSSARETETVGIMGSQETSMEAPGTPGHASAQPDPYDRKTVTLGGSLPRPSPIAAMIAENAHRRRSAQDGGLEGSIDKKISEITASMKSKRAREAAVSAVEEPPVKKLKSDDTEAKPTKKKDKKKESRKEKKEKRKDVANLPEGLGEENGDADGKMEVDVGVNGADVNGVDGVNGGEKDKDGKNKKDKKEKKKREKAGKKQVDETTDVTEKKDETNTDKDKAEKKEKKSKKSKKDVKDKADKEDDKDEMKDPKEKKDKKEKKNKKDKKDKKQPAEAKDETAPNEPNASTPQKPDRHIVFVGNLPYTATQETIRAHFSALNPTSVRCLTKRDGGGECRGVAFVEFVDGRAQRACLDRFHHSLFEGRRINVELTAGGGGKTQFRKEKIREKNQKLDENRARRIQKEMEGKDGAVASGTGQQAMGDSIHPSRLARNPRLGD